MKRFLSKIIAGLTVVVAFSGPASGAADAGLTSESIHIQRCSACHYRDGSSATSDIPNIAGQYDAYLIKALRMFKEHKRDSEAMELIASLHKEQELVILADHFSKQKPAANPRSAAPHSAGWSRGQQIFQTERVYGIACVDCHGDDAKGFLRTTPRSKNVRAIPNLAGQQPGYLKKALQQYTLGKQQTGMCGMRRAGKTLDQGDIDALVEYLSSMQPRG